MGRAMTGVKGIIEIFALAAILKLSGNEDINIKSIFFDHTDDVLKYGPASARVIVPVTGVEPSWENMYGTSLSQSQDETTADAPVQFGDEDNTYGDNSEVTSIVHSNSFEGVWDETDPYWVLVATAADSIGIDRLLYQRFFPKGKVGGAPVIHGVVEPRGLSEDFPREDFLTFSMDFPFKTRRYRTTLPAEYPLPVVP